MANKDTIRVRQYKSGIGYSKDQKATLVGLGLRRMNQVVELEDTPSVRGMVNKIRHLVRIESGE
ncbi:MAG: 50S ribosomal protein L30 [Zetaproteobacteria bacterium CG12_big_fil_rev_8_21_14_0_65_54_13]|nr:MAG: 50S ribosomal protein L30 [Zetaproteobacteria bacterium CG23_combo_of_CG06-09_8_20_14_all_54_7]PIW49125.1 MAG: 50S ribosomal protein L30 [Zetaproteobacteria bacterium CG12_big_fil_rev_8_21_14_0_65_54_13]PIX55912.1 MAG: 50S ribosomal protein L30 [Zetaproteobacteria bacterium CG_4_10_14_3_um_filter_54_28]PJA30508.1 MAG: 50S ribosomal protein L30 [Zetaproteobacteria bacterium CG_4_9_14_3_um_filter_54_145]